MRWEGEAYYVGLLKAAELHGATHQAAMQFQVVCGKRLPEIRVGRNLIVFYFRREMALSLAGVEDRKTDTGTMKISSPPLTALDLLRYPQASGGIDNVATVLAELAPAIEPKELASLSTRVERSVVQRLGYVLDWLGAGRLAQPMLETLRSKAPLRWTRLEEEHRDSYFTSDPPLRDTKWRIVQRTVRPFNHCGFVSMKHRCILSWLCIVVPGSTCLAADRLNVLFITVDDMNRDSVGVYGAKVPETTPNIDRLASEGLRFEHAHVTVALCQPTRAVWMTGRYPHNSGALGFDEIRADVPTLPETLRQVGFYTGILSKTPHVVPSRENAFEYRRQREEMLYGRSPDLYGTFVAEFLRHARRSDRPFFLMVNTDDPHRPFDTRKPPAERSLAEVDPATNRKTDWYRRDYPAPSRIYQPDEIVVPGFLPDLPEIREEIAMYYSSVRRADDVIGRVLDELKAAGFADNTLVMLKSDHGISAPFAKTNVWRHSTLTPWIVRWPGMIEPGIHETEHLVAGVDFAPTILDILGMDAMPGMDGRSFLPVLKGERQDGREFVYTQINTLFSGESRTMRSIQGKRFGLIWNAWSDGTTVFENESMKGLTWNAMVSAAESDRGVAARVKHLQYRVPLEFYDYVLDPDALDNRIHDPEARETIQAHALRLGEFMRSSGDFALPDYERLGLSP